MIATCPNNNEHKRFVTVAHVCQTWVVDENGNFLEERDMLETTHGPHPDNIWTCFECGAEAQVSDQ